MRNLCRWAWLLALFWAVGAGAQGVATVPPLSGHVVDLTATLSAADQTRLEDSLSQLESQVGSQVVILLVPTTLPEDIASFANRVGNSWKVGRKNVGDGLLLVVATSDRKVRIEVAKNLEGAIPDLAAQGIIDSAITPAFRQGQYAQGLQAAVEQISARLRGEALPAPSNPLKSAGATLLRGFDWMDFAIFLFFAVPIGGSVARRVLGVKFGGLVTGGAVGALALLVTSSLVIAAIAALLALLFTLFSGSLPAGSVRSSGSHWGGSFGSGGGFGDSSGGGFSSGGGGDFGGGGASGDW